MNKKGEVKKKRKKISPENFLKQFSQRSSGFKILSSEITTSQLSDAMMKINGETGVLEGLKPISDFKVFGKATTVQTSADDWGTVIKGIYAAEKGDVLIISCDDDNIAVWGELASAAAKKQGIAGTVVYGASRDSSGIIDLDYPVFSKIVRPNAGKPLCKGEINKPIICGTTTVKTGDLIVGDECGVVSIPGEISSKVLKEAEDILKNENNIFKQLNKGKTFIDILNI